MPPLQPPSSPNAEFQRIVIDMAALLGSLMRWVEIGEPERSSLESAIRRRRARILVAIGSLPRRADFTLSAEMAYFQSNLPEGYLNMLREDWLPGGERGG